MEDIFQYYQNVYESADGKAIVIRKQCEESTKHQHHNIWITMMIMSGEKPQSIQPEINLSWGAILEQEPAFVFMFMSQ
jgi:hypothetical protein